MSSGASSNPEPGQPNRLEPVAQLERGRTSCFPLDNGKINILSVPTIQESICKCLPRSSAAAFARTCSALFYPAIKRIWGNDVLLEHLLVLLPGVRLVSRSHLEVNLPEKLLDGDWARFGKYAQFVQGISALPIVQAVHIEPLEGWLNLLATLKTTLLLPNLTKLFSLLPETHLKEIFEVLIHPSVQEIHIASDGRPPIAALSRCFDLRTLSLDTSWNAQEGPLLGIEEIGELPSLEVVKVPGDLIGETVLLWLANLPNLRKLELTRECRGFPQINSYPPGAFHSLKSFCVNGKLADPISVWGTPMTTNLTHLRLKFFHGEWNAFDPSLLDSLVQRSPHISSFELINISDPRVQPEIEGSLLVRLQPLRDLRQLDLAGIRLSKSLTIIPQMWPLLHALELRDHVALLSDLFVISCCMPQLRYLCMKLDPNYHDLLFPCEPSSLYHTSTALDFECPLQHVGTRPLPEQNSLARYLSRLWKVIKCRGGRSRSQDYELFLARFNAKISEYAQELLIQSN